MTQEEINRRLVAVGDAVKAKGWKSASINIYGSYLAIFDRPQGPLDPMIQFQPSLQASLPDDYSGAKNYVRGDIWDCKTLADALRILEESAAAMPSAEDERNKRGGAIAKLSGDERRLLGVR